MTDAVDPRPDRRGWRNDGPRFALSAWGIATAGMLATAAVAVSFVPMVAALRAALAGERSREKLVEIAQAALASETTAWVAILASQAALLACTWLACRALRKPAYPRLGLVATGLRPGQAAAVLLATVVPFALGLAAASFVSSISGPASETAGPLQRMWSTGSRGASVTWILVIALLPGFIEEVLYRGLLQQGLLLRWGPAASILTSSLLFAVVHGDVAWAVGIFPLGVWLGVVAWRTGSVVLSFALHASVNGVWTVGMMILHRDPASESTLDGVAIALLVLGLLALPWAIAILRRRPTPDGRAAERPLSWLLPRVAGVSVVAAAACFALVPPGSMPSTPEVAAGRPMPTLEELEARAVESATCTAVGDAGAIEFSLVPGIGARVALPRNRAGIDAVIVSLDAQGQTVWLAYAGERSGKGAGRRPTGIVEQLAAGDPTVICLTLSDGPPPVSVHFTVEDTESGRLAAFERAQSAGWAFRGRE